MKRGVAKLRTLAISRRFNQMSLAIKLHLIETLIIPVLDYTPMPSHAFSKKQISKLHNVQNRALRFATNQEYPSTQTNQHLHVITNTLPVNISLHQRAVQIWQTISHLQILLHKELSTNFPNILNFPSSLTHLQHSPNPEPRYYKYWHYAISYLTPSTTHHPHHPKTPNNS